MTSELLLGKVDLEIPFHLVLLVILLPDILLHSNETKYVFIRTALSHYLTAGQIINVEGFTESAWTGNFNVYSTPGIRDFVYEAEDAAVVLNSSTVPSVTNNFSFGGNINNVYAYSQGTCPQSN